MIITISKFGVIIDTETSLNRALDCTTLLFFRKC